MRDKRSVDELSIEELERVLAIKKREARQQQLHRMKRDGRLIQTPPTPKPEAAKVQVEKPPAKLENGHHAIEPQQETALVEEPVVSALPHFEDAPNYPTTTREEQARQKKIWKRFVNFSLLLVEVAAVAGLVFLGFSLFSAIGELESETRSAQQITNATRQASLPTLAPTPTLRIDEVVLPGGHTINEDNQGVPNFEEIPDSVPEHLLPVVQQQLLRPSIARPPRTPETALSINIPALNVDETIVQGADWEALQAGVGQVINGFGPYDNSGNIVLAAHNDIYGEIFKDLDQMEVGDEFFVQTENSIVTYVVTGTEIVDPTDVHVMESRGRPTATLISCYPYRVNNKRYIVYADRVDA